jgi:hypothetical protein
MTAPSTRSEWPPISLVTECMTRSAPWSRGRWRKGEANVLSTTTSAPTDLARPITAGRSTTSSIGFVGDSIHTSPTPSMVAVSPSTVRLACGSCSRMPRAARCCIRLATPKYGARWPMTRLPLGSSSRIADVAARPDENVTQWPPSSSPSAASSACQPGLPSRPYSTSFPSPKWNVEAAVIGWLSGAPGVRDGRPAMTASVSGCRALSGNQVPVLIITCLTKV